MAKIPRRIDQVTHPLLEHPRFGKSAISLALPYLLSVAGDVKNSACTWH